MKKTLIFIFCGLLGLGVFSVTTSMAEDLMRVDIHGFISQGYLATFNDDSTSSSQNEKSFSFNEVGLNFGSDLTNDLHIGIQFLGRDFNEMSGIDINIDWAFADYRYKDWLGMRFGQMKMPHGLYNEIRDIDMLRTPIFLPESIYHELSHDLHVNDIYLSLQGISSRELYISLQGIGVYGYLNTNSVGGFSYQAMFGTQNIDPDTKLSRKRTQHLIDTIADIDAPSDVFETDRADVDYKFAANLIWDVPLEGLRLGLSFDTIKMTNSSKIIQDVVIADKNGNQYPLISASTKLSMDYDTLQNWVGSLEYTWNDLILMAEYIKTNKKYIMHLAHSPSAEKKSEPWGWYAGGAYRLLKSLELGAYYSQSESNDLDFSSAFPPIDYYIEFADYCVTTRFDINAYWILKLEAHRLRGIYGTQKLDEVFTNNYSEVEQKWNMYAVKATVAF